MPLVKCPDCGKMVSSRVTSCPFCGCPSEYFEAETDSASAIVTGETMVETENTVEPIDENSYDDGMDSALPTTDELSYDVVEETGLPDQTSNSIAFNFNGLELEEPTYAAPVAKKLGEFMARARKAAEAVDKMYTEAKDLETALKKYYDLADDYVFEAADEAVRILYTYGVYTDVPRFLDKYADEYSLNVVPLTDNIFSQYQGVVQTEAEIQEYRDLQKASRTRWQGGGFGIGGAIKGYAKAGAMNLASSALHAPVDAARKASDKSKINNEFDKIYKDPSTKNQLLDVTFTAVKNVYLAMYKELSRNGVWEEWQNFNPQKAADIYYATKTNEKDESKILASTITAMFIDPSNPTYLSDVYLAMLQGDNNFEDWISFWGLEIYCGDFKAEKNWVKTFDDYMADHGINEFNFGDRDSTNVNSLREMLYNFKRDTSLDIPGNSRLYTIIRAFFKSATNDPREINDYFFSAWIPEDISLDEYIDIIKDDIKYYNFEFVDKVLDYKGDDAGGAKVKRKLLDDGSDIILYDNSSFTGVGNKGFAMTTGYFWDLKSDIRIPLNKVKNISVTEINGANALKITGNYYEITWQHNNPDYFDNIEGRYRYFYYVLNDLLIRFFPYDENAPEEEPAEEDDSAATVGGMAMDVMSKVTAGLKIPNFSMGRMVTCSNCGKKVKADSKFCTYCGSLIVIDEQESSDVTTVCPNCGKAIKPGTKFCNYCGAKISVKETPNHNSDSNVKIVCNNCGKELAPGSKFCVYCGTPVKEKEEAMEVTVCPSCGKALKPGTKFCNFCGAKIVEAIQPDQPSMNINQFMAEYDTASQTRGGRQSGYTNEAYAKMGPLEQYIVDNFGPETKIQAIKYYREHTGLGLKEAKDKIDVLLAAKTIQ